MKDTIRFVLTLVIVTIISGLVLSFVYLKVKGKIEVQLKMP